MKYPDNIREVAALQPDYMGFIFYKESPRYCGEELLTTYDLSLTRINKVGVFVNEPVSSVVRLATRFDLDLIQLHGDESPEYCEDLKLLDFKLIKAFGIDLAFDFSVLGEYEGTCDYFMFDTRSDAYGGSGQKFSWSLLKKYQGSKPIFLSGGLDKRSIPLVHDLINGLNIHALDFNSKLEMEPGRKEMEKCREVIEMVHLLSF